jgi:hypothetical protein
MGKTQVERERRRRNEKKGMHRKCRRMLFDHKPALPCSHLLPLHPPLCLSEARPLRTYRLL